MNLEIANLQEETIVITEYNYEVKLFLFIFSEQSKNGFLKFDPFCNFFFH